MWDTESFDWNKLKFQLKSDKTLKNVWNEKDILHQYKKSCGPWAFYHNMKRQGKIGVRMTEGSYRRKTL